MKAVVDNKTCIGCGLCIDVCPQVFVMEQDGKAAVRNTVVPPDSEVSCREAGQQCPVEAITITE